MAKKYYRADQRCFESGMVIFPQGTYQNKFKAYGKAMEENLENARPKLKPCRKGCLFVFEDLQEVERYWETHDGSYLYQVKIDEAAVLHCGDMQLTDMIGDEFRKLIAPPDRDRVSELAKTYWAGGQSAKPILEFLVPSAEVVEKLKDRSDRHAWLDSKVTKYNPADDPPIEQMLGIKGAKGTPESAPTHHRTRGAYARSASRWRCRSFRAA
jgi:hypothetical protein